MVGFRYFVVGQARVLGVTGWVRNLNNGEAVEVVAEGTPEALRRLEAALREGPPHARVDDVAARWSDDVEGHERFEVRW